MAHFAVKPSLATLPPELIAIAFSYSHSLEVAITVRIDDLEGQAASLRALSQTCRQLRALTLPMVWLRVQVETVKKLGKLRELLRAVPSIAPLIKSFGFGWHMDHDCTEEQLWAYKKGSVLDLAFCDRRALWQELMQSRRAALASNGDDVLYSSQLCVPPGERPDYSLIRQAGLSAYDWQAGKRGRGPDGQGEDSLIKSGTQLIKCATEVVGLLTSLETFGWETPVLPMPRGVFDALTRLKALTDLRLRWSDFRSNMTDLPFWKISGRLRALSIWIDTEEDHDGSDEVDSLTEAMLTTTEGRVSRLVEAVRAQDAYSKYGEFQFHAAIACHAIVVAARGGQLKRLSINCNLHLAFAVPSLLPCWLRIEEWDGGFIYSWQAAATLLRPFLAHASRRRDWLRASSTDAVLDRRLTHQDILELYIWFKNDGKMEVWSHNGDSYDNVVYYYLPWLVEDARLREQVLDTWNSIVDRGEADKVECPCNPCQATFGKPAWNERSRS